MQSGATATARLEPNGRSIAFGCFGGGGRGGGEPLCYRDVMLLEISPPHTVGQVLGITIPWSPRGVHLMITVSYYQLTG